MTNWALIILIRSHYQLRLYLSHCFNYILQKQNSEIETMHFKYFNNSHTISLLVGLEFVALFQL